MSRVEVSPGVDADADRRAFTTAATIATAAAVLLLARHFLSAGGGTSWSDIVAVALFNGIALVVGFGLVVPKALRTSPDTAALAALALAVLSVPVLVVFFFSGAPFVLGYAAWFLSRTSLVRAAGGWRPRATEIVGLVVMGLSLLANVVLLVSAWNPGIPH